jgi:hypothetical protein
MGNRRAARVPVSIRARPSNTKEMVPVPFWDVTRWASESVALAFLAAALVVVCVSAVHIIAMNELGIGPEQKTFWALEHRTEAFLICACRQVLQCACRVLT